MSLAADAQLVRLPLAQGDDERTITSTVLARIRRDIISGALPPGTKLRIKETQERYGVGFTPLREALSRLAVERWVVAEGQRGYWVAPVSLEDMADIVRVRQSLETMAMKLAIERGDEQWEADLVAAFHRLTRAAPADDGPRYDEAWEERHLAFHLALLSGCKSEWLMHLTRRFLESGLRYRHMSMARLNIPYGDHLREHREMMEAALARDVVRACAMVELHFLKIAVLVVDRNLFPPPPAGSLAAAEMVYLREQWERVRPLLAERV